jgi:diguanylate cyclase (GGDEF)-like protein
MGNTPKQSSDNLIYSSNVVTELFIKIQQFENLLNANIQHDHTFAGLSSIKSMLMELAGKGDEAGLPLVNLSAGYISSEIDKILADRNQTRSSIEIIHNEVERLKRSLEEIQFESETPSIKPREARTRIYGRLNYLEDNESSEEHKELINQIGYFGYEVTTFTNIMDLKVSLHDSTPTAVLMDVVFKNGELRDAKFISEFHQMLPANVPLILFSEYDDLSSRLQAVRAGGVAYFTKPVDIVALTDSLDHASGGQPLEPYRVLLVEDSKFQAMLYAQVLIKAGMDVQIITDPMTILDALTEYNPDLILLDMYMPACTGMELAQVIRQNESFVSMPIVYLSSETDKDKQLEAMSLGGDDFLAKPIQPHHLIAAVTSRVERYRKLRTFMTRDGLTGLFNHTTIKERLEQEISRARRHGHSISFAMLDLDKFKAINDTYGHTTGDRVLRSLSRLLRQRLRRTDVIGRYGGEEFAVILPETDIKIAFKVMDELRKGFANINQTSGSKRFKTTFSCGVAEFPTYSSASEITEAADQALYAAKTKGRNRVESAQPTKLGSLNL